MIPRTSEVNHIHIRSMLFSSIVNIGDTDQFAAFSQALAIQKYEPTFDLALSGLINFPNYQAFTIPRPRPTPPKEVTMESYNDPAYIRVGVIDILGISTAAMLHIGGIQNIDLESRVKHIRDYRTNPDPKNLAIVPVSPVSRHKQDHGQMREE
ncbi:spore germination protein GerPE [Fictibacillus sp. WQ 8-8]|uniref:spore germination protein GerPE n=1 Tax=unclassified Fictibacillus TaxID=2644029 RepID=UPI000B81F7C3|nr:MULTISPECIES: spore germination protein GerPE [unclassified Fictibacillus]MCQ6267466.1 spore germination protein GerPE [Fictibacillus sp. WQ 8-8]MED2973044.1 spore germination protein GerPE [Fictibacillus sp. B-59209]